MNILHMKYAVEVAKTGSLNKAAERLLTAQPNISRAIKELESHLGITIFDRSTRGMKLTPQGEEFIGYAQGILRRIDEVEQIYTAGHPLKIHFSICVPRAAYISEAFIRFSNKLDKSPAEVFYKETNSERTIKNVLNSNYKLGIIRYADVYDKFFKQMFEEKSLSYEKVTEFKYRLVMSKNHPLAPKDEITYDDLSKYIEVVHGDPYVPSLPISRVMREELSDNISRRIYLFERATQYGLLANNLATFMWCSSIPETFLDGYGLVCKKCIDNKRTYKDVLIYKKDYKLTELDREFIAELRNSENQKWPV